jgi:raffinose/stachyose/melibiose transport system permease protein
MAFLREDTQLSEAAPEIQLPAGEGAASPSPAVPRPIARSRWPQRAELLLLIGPALVVFVAFVILPVALAAYYAFFSWSGYGAATDFVGLRNYATILTDPAFHEALSRWCCRGRWLSGSRSCSTANCDSSRSSVC